MITLAISLAAAWFARDRIRQAEEAVVAAQARPIEAGLREASVLRDEARKHLSAPVQWEATLKQARTALVRAEDLLEKVHGLDDLREQARLLLNELDDDDRDREMVQTLARIGFARTDVRDGHFDGESAAAGYEKAFSDYGVDVLGLPIDEIVGRIKAHPVWPQLVAALEDWASLTIVSKERRKKLMDVASAAAPHPLLNPLRQRWPCATCRRWRSRHPWRRWRNCPPPAWSNWPTPSRRKAGAPWPSACSIAPANTTRPTSGFTTSLVLTCTCSGPPSSPRRPASSQSPPSCAPTAREFTSTCRLS